jgi:hypothetical protein
MSPLPHRVLTGLVAHLTSLVLGMAGPAFAAPDTASVQDNPGADAVLQLLREKGLVPLPTVLSPQAPPTRLMRQVRQVGDLASDLVISAMNFLGVPYRNGGNGSGENGVDAGFDCSGFTRHIFEHSLGLVLPRRAEQQAQTAGLADVQREELRPGDLVFFNTMKKAFSHVGIYVGEGRFIHSPRVGGEVRIEDMRQAYWAQRFNGARRAQTTPERGAAPSP